ncbi:hypothetical protein EYR36_002936 [Pleurotus pulmonarius]|nr:hypothetical protein EYR36_002936 [Pleurotus pulmonarius]
MKSTFVLLAAACSLVYAIPSPTAYPADSAGAPGLPEGAQCGGIEHTGPTECAPGLICHGFNDVSENSHSLAQRKTQTHTDSQWLVFYCVKPSPRPTTTRTPTPTRSCSVAIETTTKQPPAPAPNGLPLVSLIVKLHGRDNMLGSPHHHRERSVGVKSESLGSLLGLTDQPTTGIDYNGPTQCATGLICHGFNDVSVIFHYP